MAFADHFRGPLDRFAIADPRLVDADVQIVIAQQSMLDDFQVQFAHAAEISVWPVSSFSRARNVGSCRFIISSTSASFLRSVELSGSMAIEITVSGKSIDSSTIGACASHSVSPVIECRRPMTPTMSPA